MEKNVIYARFTGQPSLITQPVFQYDYGQRLRLIGFGVPDAFETHFTKSGKSITVLGTADDEAGFIGNVDVPDELLQSPGDLVTYIFLHENDTDGETEYVIRTQVLPRPAPTETATKKSSEGFRNAVLASAST